MNGEAEPAEAADPGGAEAREPAPDRATCTPCRGTGKLVSSLGGTAHTVGCPWCGGEGRFIPGRDAQASPAEARAL